MARNEAEALFAEHLRLADGLARAFYRSKRGALELDEFQSLARIGLWEAAKRFPGGDILDFELYAKARIRGAMLDGMRRASWFSRRRHARAREGQPLPRIVSGRALNVILDDFTEPEEALGNVRQTRQLSAALERLPERDRNLLRWLFFKDCTLNEVGARLGVTDGRVIQLRTRALERLRKILEES